MNLPDLTMTQWRKSSHSAHEGGDCIEVAATTDVVGVRDSKDADGPRLVLTTANWQALTRQIKNIA
ncbi:DUF397 domain-containing protein [Actinomadura oligospora]|uniref:DUF397 domain-containing protein n=1 Tax=Actinomadura oligospora TaxID=111804 RepID=UPI00047B04A2|nr:DUF397 domain-containing protein [Actinomadura oligospora]